MSLNIVQQYKSDVAFKTLVEGVNDNLYFIPKFQRKFRWKKEQVQDLARSLVKGYPIPPIYAYRNDQGQLEILDGQQRVMSLYFYYIGKIINTNKVSAVDYRKLNIRNRTYRDELMQNYPMVDLVTYLEKGDNKSQNISYQSLPMETKRKVDYTTVTVIELRWDNPAKRSTDLQQIFKNLNANGTKLSPQEIRNGIYDCSFYDMLRELNNNDDNWKRIRGMESDKEEDMEFLLRLCTVEKNVDYIDEAFVINNYHGKYSVWMDEFSEEAAKMNLIEIEHYKMKLEKFFSRFQVKKTIGLKKALLESLFVVTEKILPDVLITDHVFEKVSGASDYKDTTQQGMVKKSKMNERWKVVYAVLGKINK